MRYITVAAALVAVTTLAACKKTGEGEYEVQKPVVGTQADTVRTPTVEVGKDTTTVNVPNVQVKKDTAKIVTPTVKVKKP